MRTRVSDADHWGAVAAALAALAPLAFFPWGLERWVLAKVAVWIVVALIALFAVATGRTPKWWSAWLAAAFLLIATAAALGEAPLAQAVGRWPRYEGVLTLGSYAVALWCGARLSGPRAGALGGLVALRGRIFLKAFAWSMALVAVIAAAEAAGMRPLGGEATRPGSLLGNASDQGIFGVIGLALFVPGSQRWAASRQSRRTASVMPLLGLASAAVVVTTSASRAALGAAAVVLVVHLIMALRGGASRGSTLGGLGVVAAGIALASLALPLTRARVGGTSQLAQETVTSRVELWRATVDVWRSHPVTGVGPNGFSDAVTGQLSDTWFHAVGSGSWVESPHNVILQVGAAGGLAGLALVAAAIACAVRQVRRDGLGGPLGVSGVAALAGWAVGVSTHATSPGTTLLAAFLAGSLLAREASAVVRWRRLAAGAALAAWVLVLGAALAGDAALYRGMKGLESDPAAAAADFDRARALRPWDADLALMVAEAYAGAASAGVEIDPAAAATWSARAVDGLPASTRALKAQGVIAFHVGDTALARAALERASVLSPTDPEVFHWWGGALLIDGEIEAAVSKLERARMLDPDNEGIRETLEYARSVGQS